MPDKSVVYKTDLRTIFQYVQISEGNEERINGYKRKVSSFLPPPCPPCCLLRKSSRMSYRSYKLSKPSSKIQAHKPWAETYTKKTTKILWNKDTITSTLYKINPPSICQFVCLSAHSTASRDSAIAKKNPKQVNVVEKKNIFCYYGNRASKEIPILDMFNPYLSNATMASWDMW